MRLQQQDRMRLEQQRQAEADRMWLRRHELANYDSVNENSDVRLIS